MEGFVDGSGIVAVARSPNAAHRASLGLHALQHRGTGGVALAASDGDLVRYHRGAGLVQDVLGGATLGALVGHLAVGQVYGRSGVPGLAVADLAERMWSGRWAGGQAAVAMSGRLTNGTRLRRELKERGALFHTGADAEVLMHLVAQSGQGTFVNRWVDALWKVEGAFSLLVCTEDRLVAVRDPRGFRPLWMGRVGDAVVFATEDTAVRLLGATPQRELRAGEMMIVDARGIQTVQPFARRPGSACIQELVTLARPDARVFARDAYRVRQAMGGRLGVEAPCPEAGVVVSLPGPAEAIAIGYARAAQLPYERGLVPSVWPGRFEAPSGSVPHLETRLLPDAVPAVVAGRSVVLVAPSLVTGQGVRRAITVLRDAGARAVHVRIASPIVRSACVYGVSSPTVDELIAREADVASAVEAASVAHLSMTGLVEAMGALDWCHACLDADYPLPPEEPDDQLPLF